MEERQPRVAGAPHAVRLRSRGEHRADAMVRFDTDHAAHAATLWLRAECNPNTEQVLISAAPRPWSDRFADGLLAEPEDRHLNDLGAPVRHSVGRIFAPRRGSHSSSSRSRPLVRARRRSRTCARRRTARFRPGFVSACRSCVRESRAAVRGWRDAQTERATFTGVDDVLLEQPDGATLHTDTAVTHRGPCAPDDASISNNTRSTSTKRKRRTAHPRDGARTRSTPPRGAHKAQSR